MYLPSCVPALHAAVLPTLIARIVTVVMRKKYEDRVIANSELVRFYFICNKVFCGKFKHILCSVLLFHQSRHEIIRFITTVDLH
jgi:hypothetical protein